MYDPHSQRPMFAPSRSNKCSREEFVEMNAEMMQRANRLSGGYQSKADETEETENTEEGHIDLEQEETDKNSVKCKGHNLPIVDLCKFITDGKEDHYIQNNYIVGKLSGNKRITKETVKKAELDFMRDLKSLITSPAIDLEITILRASMGRKNRETIPDGYGPVFEKLSMKWIKGLVIMDDRAVVPVDLRRRLLDILHYGQASVQRR